WRRRWRRRILCPAIDFAMEPRHLAGDRDSSRFWRYHQVRARTDRGRGQITDKAEATGRGARRQGTQTANFRLSRALPRSTDAMVSTGEHGRRLHVDRPNRAPAGRVRPDMGVPPRTRKYKDFRPAGVR